MAVAEPENGQLCASVDDLLKRYSRFMDAGKRMGWWMWVMSAG